MRTLPTLALTTAVLTVFAASGCIQPQKPGDGVDEAEPEGGDPAPPAEEPAAGDEEVTPDGPNWGEAGRGGGAPEPGPEPEPPLSDVCAEATDMIADGRKVDDGSFLITGRNGGADHLAGSCGGDGGEDVVFRFDAPKEGMWRFETVEEETRFDSLLHVRTACDDPDTEVACNDDILEGRIRNSRVDVPLAAGDSAFIVVDAWGDETGRFALSAKLVPTLEPGAECDPDGERAVCPAGTFCRVPAEAFHTDQVILGECVPSAAPVLDTLTARIVGDVLVVTVTGSDASKDVLGMSMQFMQGGRPLRMGRHGGGRDTFDVGFDESVYGQERFEATRSSEEILRFANVDGVRAALLDSEGNVSAWLEVAVETAPEVEEGGECDLAGLDSICAAGAVCVEPPVVEGEPEPVAGVCKVPTRPAIARVEAFLNAESNAIGLRIIGADPDRDVVGLTVRLFDEEGLRVPSSPDGSGAPGSEMDLRFAEGAIEWIEDDEGPDGSFVAEASRALPADWDGIHSVRLRAYDATDQHSDQAEALFQPTPELAEGEACDAGGGLRACPAGQVCDPATAQCAVPIAECPAEWEVIDLADHHHENGRYVYRGSTEGAEDHTGGQGGSCGGGAAQDIFEFTAPGEPDPDAPAQEWLFETDIEGRFDDTVMYARSHCRYDGPIAELACNDDVEAGRMTASRIALNLTPGQTVYVFVDGWQGDGFAWRGEYTLVVTRNEG